MPRWLKVVLGIVGTLILLCLLGGGGFALWLNANKDELKQRGDAVKKEGEAFGREADANGCVTEGLRRLDERRGILDQALNNVFLEECLKVATQPGGFCKDVPARGDVLITATWAVDECTRRGHPGDQECGRMVQVIQKVCAR